MENKTIYPEGINAFKKHSNAPDFIICDVIVSPNKLFKWIKANEGLLTEYNGEKQIKLQLVTRKDGSPTFTVNTFKPKAKDPIEQLKETFDAVEVPTNDLPF